MDGVGGAAWPATGGDGWERGEGSCPLSELNRNINYNFLSTLDTQPNEYDIVSPYIQYSIDSKYYDTQSLINSQVQQSQPALVYEPQYTKPAKQA